MALRARARGSQQTAPAAASSRPMATSRAWSAAPTKAPAPWPAPRRSNRTVPTTAIPIDMASCCTDSSRPEAEPSSWGRTPARMTSNMGTKTMPIPKPVMASGATSVHASSVPEASRMTTSQTSSPVAIVIRPMCIVARPILASSTDEVIDPAIAASGTDTVARPLSSGEKPSPAWYMTFSAIIIPPIAPMNPSDHGETGDVGAAAQQRRLHQRGLTAPRAPALQHREGAQQPQPPGHQPEAPRRPALLAALDQRVHDAQRRRPWPAGRWGGPGARRAPPARPAAGAGGRRPGRPAPAAR